MAAAQSLEQHPVFQGSMQIACYIPYGDEFSTHPIIEMIWRTGKCCYLPVLIEGRMLNFVRYDKGDELFANQFSILEPKNASRKLAPEKLDLVISPLVAFDRHGHRLGTGGGYYDRTFAFMYDQKVTKPLMYGLGFASQQVEELPRDPWDITLNGIITEKGVIEITAQQSIPIVPESR